MRPFGPIFYVVTGSIFAAITAGVVWYRMPMNVESLNRLSYCACGLTEVEFRNGEIIMRKYHHDAPKPGEIIGGYKVNGKKVELNILFNGKWSQDTLMLDHIGLQDTSTPFSRYRAVSGTSGKIYVYFLLGKLGL